jgi:hypothetical protein
MRPSNPLKPNVGNETPPSAAVKSAPYNFGEGLLPHVVTFQGIVSTTSRIYRYYDEAMKHSFDNARFMRNDLMVMEPVEQRRRACALLNWHLEVDDEDNSRQKELAENLTKLIKAIPNFLKFKENLLDAVWYGKNANQWRWAWKKIHGVESANGHYGNMVIADWKPLGGDKIVFRYDDGLREYDPNQIGIRVGAGYTAGDKGIQGRMLGGPSGTRKVEACDYGLAYFLEPWERKLLAVHKHMIEDGEYEDPQSAGKIHGVGIRSRIYWSWYMKQELHAWMMEFLERNAAGMEVWYYPTGNPEAEEKTRKAAEERIGNARNVILMPRPVDDGGNQYGVEIIPANMGGADTVERILTEYFGDQIMRYILGQTMTNKPQAGGFGSDLPQIQYGTYSQIIRYDAINLGETLTTDVVAPLLELNYPQYRDIPVRFVVDTESEDMEAKLNAWKSAYEVGLKTKASDWYKLIGASKPEQDDETVENPVTKQQDRLYEQWQANKQGEVTNPMQPGAAQVQGGIGGPEAGGPVDMNAGGQPPTELPPIDPNAIGGGLGGQADQEDYSMEQASAPAVATAPVRYAEPTGKITQAAIARGTMHEMEHTKNVQVAREIAMDHLRERPDYYEVLERAMVQPPTVPIENSEREKLAKYSLAESIKTAADQTDTNPSDEQKQAGNYRKGKVWIQGLEIAIENPAGSIRRGKNWQVTMANHYGYIKTHISEADGDHVDVFVGPHPESEVVFIVDQNKRPTWTHFDEHKVMLGFTSEEKAKQAYLDNYSPGWQGFAAITSMTMPQFKEWLEKGSTAERAVDQVLKYAKHKPAVGQSSLFDEDAHPRGGKGSEKGGQFVSKGEGDSSKTDSEAESGSDADKPMPLPGQRDIFGGVEPEAKPKTVADEPPPPAKQRQESMFHGLKDAPGQQDLFNADKGAEELEDYDTLFTKYLALQKQYDEETADLNKEHAELIQKVRKSKKKFGTTGAEKRLAEINHAQYEVWKRLGLEEATIALRKAKWAQKKEPYSRSFDAGLIHRQLLERYYKQSTPEAIDAWWAGGPGAVVVVQDGRPLRYSRGSRGNVTVECVA